MNAVSENTSPELNVRDWEPVYEGRKKTATKALRVLKRGNRIFIGSGCAEPQHLVSALEKTIVPLSDIEILHILSLGKSHYTESSFFDNCRLKSFFVAAATREAVAEGRADYTPINISDISGLFRSGATPIDAALIQVSPPDSHGFCSYGISVDIVKAATETARHVIAQVNPSMPRTLGDSFIHVSEIDAFVEFEEPLLEMPGPLINSTAEAISSHTAKLIEDGSTIRAGVGSIPNAVLSALLDKKDLGVHTDMLTDAYLPLVEAGVITNARKTLHQGKMVASFCMGTRKLYDFVRDNPMVALYPIEYTNDFLVIAQNDKMVSINSALQVDLTGQVCSDSVGFEIYSGIGGAVDFLRGARSSRGGKAIMALPSTTLEGDASRIVPVLAEGGGVVITRGGVQHVVTEYGAAQLHGMSIRERALALIGIAHPDFREGLMRAARDLNYIPREMVAVGAAKALYPADMEVYQLFDRDLKVLFRPVKPTDERSLKEFFYSLPREEAYVRFLRTMKVYPRYDTLRMVNIDYDKVMNIVGIAGEPGAERTIALGGYYLDGETLTAELDCVVHPEYQGLGVATFLIHRLTEIARGKSVRRLRTYVSPNNTGVFALFQKLGFVVGASLDNGLYEIRVDIEEAAGMCLTDGCVYTEEGVDS